MHPTQIAIRSKDFDPELRAELEHAGITVLNQTPLALWLKEDRFEATWADCVWRDVRCMEIDSVADGQRKLRALSKTWNYFGDLMNRRGHLISEGLTPKPDGKPIHFPTAEKGGRLPAFTLADSNRILYSHSVQRRTVDGRIHFQENTKVPPSRAYLKLWEALTLLGDWPRMGDRALDLGSSPGSWSWALARQHAHVLSVDRSPLTDAVMASGKIEFRQGDAFALKPTPMDWVFSDVICFPEKLYEYAVSWIESGHCEKFVCNIKFSGEVDPRIVERFRKLPHSRVIHLLHGKKEATWIRHPKLP